MQLKLCTWAVQGRFAPSCAALPCCCSLETDEEVLITLHMVAVQNTLCLAQAALAMLLLCNERLIEHNILIWQCPMC